MVLPDAFWTGFRQSFARSQCTYRCVVLPDGWLLLKDRPGPESLNAPTGAWCSLTSVGRSLSSARDSLNAPTGAWCSLTGFLAHEYHRDSGLNAPTGAWCSLTRDMLARLLGEKSLNAPTGAWCSLTRLLGDDQRIRIQVSMHLQVRGAP